MQKLLTLLFVSIFFVSGSAEAGMVLLSENFESTLDTRITVTNVGQFSSGPGIKNFVGLEGSKAFGFGRSFSPASAFFNFTTTLNIAFNAPTFVSTVSFIEREAFGNWGSQGEFYTSAEFPPPSSISDPRVLSGDWGNDFGRLPHNDFTSDGTFRTRSIAVNALVTSLHLQVWDITNQSEIYIDDLVVRGAAPVPEPSTAMIFAVGSFCAVAGKRFRRRV